MGICGLVIFLFLAPHPSDVGCGRPSHVKVRKYLILKSTINKNYKVHHNASKYLKISSHFFVFGILSGVE